MRSLLRRLHPARRALSRHVQRLRQALDGLGERLRDGLALAIGQSVAAAVHEAVQAALGDLPEYPTTSYPLRAPPRARSLWGEREQPSWDDDLDEPLPEENDEASTAANRTDRETPPPARWPGAVAAGLQAAAWWLRRQAGRCSLVVASGIGLLTALGAYAGGSVAVAGLGLAGAALSLLSLAQTVQVSAGLLGVLPTA